ncbi:MAG: hypothetical protein V1709_07590 [Planctomycetota bacterium]
MNVQTLKQEDAALLVSLANKSSYYIKVTYPTATGYITPYQDVVLQMSGIGNHKIVVTAYTQDKDRGNIYQPISTTEIPVYLDGYTLVNAPGKFVGALIEVTNGMFSDISVPNKEQKKDRK